MKLNNFYIFVVTSIVLLTTHCSPEKEIPDPKPPVGEYTPPPGVIINHSRSSTNIYLGSPSICILPNGDYLVSHDESGSGTLGYPNTTRIYQSTDKGITWERISSISTGQTWSNIFSIDNIVYVFGVKAPIGPCAIRKSTDGGKIWTEPVDANSGLLMSGWNYHTAPTPVVVHNGRVWRAIEAKNPAIDIWPKQYNAMMMSAPVDADLLKASSWTKSNQIQYHSSYLDGNFGGWLEGNAVVDKNGKIKNILRVDFQLAMDEYVAIVDVSDDGKTINFDPENGFVKMQGGAKKFTIHYDEQTDRYWTLTNYIESKYKYMIPGSVRNIQTLCSSSDLRTWTVHKIVLKHEEVKYHAFQYVDWIFDGNDIIFVSRTSYDDAFGGANSAHNANYITFHRIENFRNYLDKTLE
jgi:hypothetical protein